MTIQTDNAAQALELASVRDDLAFDHGAISRFNAWFFTAFASYLNHVGRIHKRAAFANMRAGTVVEIGAGTGANFDYLPRGTHLYAVEPNLRMHARLRERAAAAAVSLTLLGTGAEAIPLPDESVDEVICSLVLCTVPDPDQVLAEVRRVLRPGGTFRFAEHVAADPSSVRHRIQRALRRPWGYLFEGCNPARNTPDTVASAGFRELRIERRKLRHSVFWPVNTAVWGIAVK
ncbi:MAG TPA: class I SAM-dependent methyltransferase [Jiangellaceae bacterium]|nr:class I SAM-dependent methyltransferase [Jiangellaceae bacterium]